MLTRKPYISQTAICVRILSACLTLFPVGSACAEEWESLDDVTVAVERFVKEKTVDKGNLIEVSVTRPDARLHLRKCETLETWLPSGNKLWGRASVGVRCRAPATWSIYVPVMVKVTGNALIAARPIARGQTVEVQDIQSQIRDLTIHTGGVLNSPEQVIGKTAAVAIPAGELLRPGLLRSPLSIRQGQQVILVAQGSGFKVSSEGTAMGNAASGQVVSVKTRSGQVIKGVAKGDGVVEVYF